MTEMVMMKIGLFLCNHIVSSVKILKVQLQRISVDFKGVDLGFLLHLKDCDSPSVLAAYCQAPARGEAVGDSAGLGRQLWQQIYHWGDDCVKIVGTRPPPALVLQKVPSEGS